MTCPPWAAVYQPPQRRLAAGVFEALVHDLRTILRLGDQRAPSPRAVVLDSRPLQATPASGARAGYDGHKRRKGSKLPLVVDPLGHLLALTVTPAAVPARAQGTALAAAVQRLTGSTVELADVDQGYTGLTPALDAAEPGIYLAVVKLAEAKRGFVLLPRRWVVERSFAWATRFRRLAKDYERLPATLAGLHFVAFACLMLHQAITMFAGPYQALGTARPSLKCPSRQLATVAPVRSTAARCAEMIGDQRRGSATLEA